MPQLDRIILAVALSGATLLGPGGLVRSARAADIPAALAAVELPAFRPGPAPVEVVEPGPARARLTYRDVRTGRCLPGFVENLARNCVRHDVIDLACSPPTDLGSGCIVVPPSPTPYGIGASLRLNY